MAKALLRALTGEAVWPPPIWLMRQAGRYLPEYRQVRAKAGDFLTLCTTPALATEVTLQPLRRYGFDAAILFSDILILPWALGQDLSFAEGEGPVLSPIRDAQELAGLDPGRVSSSVAPVLETVERLRNAVDDAALIGFAGAPFTVACYMVEGRGTKEFPQTRLLAYRDPALFVALIDMLVASTTEYLSAQIAAGAEAVMLFDSWAGALPPSAFRRFVTAPTETIVRVLKTRHPQVPIIGFPRGAGTMAAEFADATGVNGLGFDTSADPVHVAATLPKRVAAQGNLDPLALQAGGSAMAEDTAAILAAMRGRPFVFNLGHGIVPGTPPEHVSELVRQVRGA